MIGWTKRSKNTWFSSSRGIVLSVRKGEKGQVPYYLYIEAVPIVAGGSKVVSRHYSKGAALRAAKRWMKERPR